MKSFGLIFFLVSTIFAHRVIAGDRCIPTASVICTVRCTPVDVIVTTSFELVSTFHYDDTTSTTFLSATKNGIELATELRKAGVCAFVVDNTSVCSF